MRQEGKVFRFEFKQIDSSKIKAASYQRLIKTRKVKKIVENFDQNLVHVVKVSFRDGVYWDFDGDHTVVSCKEHNGGKDLAIWCKVFYDMTYEDEAYYFAKQNGYSSLPTKNETLRARHEAGDSEQLKAYELILRCAGFEVDYSDAPSLDKTPRCHATLFGYFEKDRESFIDMIDILQSVWYGEKTAFNITLLSGLFKFIVEYQRVPNYNLKTLKKQLSKKSPSQVVKACRETADTGEYKRARVILKMYNQGLRKENRLVDTFDV